MLDIFGRSLVSCFSHILPGPRVLSQLCFSFLSIDVARCLYLSRWVLISSLLGTLSESHYRTTLTTLPSFCVPATEVPTFFIGSLHSRAFDCVGVDSSGLALQQETRGRPLPVFWSRLSIKRQQRADFLPRFFYLHLFLKKTAVSGSLSKVGPLPSRQK